MTFLFLLVIVVAIVVFFITLFLNEGFYRIGAPLFILECIGFIVSFIIGSIITISIEPKEEIGDKATYTIESYEFQQQQIGKTSSTEFFCWIDKEGRHSEKAAKIKFVNSDRYEVEKKEIHITNYFWCSKKDYIIYTVYIPNSKLYKNSPWD